MCSLTQCSSTDVLSESEGEPDSGLFADTTMTCVAAGCPVGCLCVDTTVICNCLGLTEVPSGIPTDTTKLYVFVCFGTSGPL